MKNAHSLAAYLVINFSHVLEKFRFFHFHLRNVVVIALVSVICKPIRISRILNLLYFCNVKFPVHLDDLQAFVYRLLLLDAASQLARFSVDDGTHYTVHRVVVKKNGAWSPLHSGVSVSFVSRATMSFLLCLHS